jgi:hypothetical protein
MHPVPPYNSCGDRHCPTCQAGLRARWLDQRRAELLPVAYYHVVFRGKLLDFINQAYRAGNLPMTGGLSELAGAARFAQWLSALYQKHWVVYVEPPEEREPDQALKYLARYTYRVAISNNRLESIRGEADDGEVTFWYKDYAREGVWDRMTLPGVEFLRRLMQHVLPRGSVRIRSFGFLANRHRAEKLAIIRRLLAREETSLPPLPAIEPTEDPGHRCPHCGQPTLRLGNRNRPPKPNVSGGGHLPLEGTWSPHGPKNRLSAAPLCSRAIGQPHAVVWSLL